MIHGKAVSTPEARDRPNAKLRPLWYGPYKVIAVGTNTVKVDLPWYIKAHPVFNVDSVKLFVESEIKGRERRPPPVMTDEDGGQRYLVQEILKVRTRKRKKEYLVRWEGYGPDDDSWEPLENLLDQDGKELKPLRDFKTQGGLVGGGRV